MILSWRSEWPECAYRPGGLSKTAKEGRGPCRIAVYYRQVDVAREITVLQLPRFRTEATALIGAGGIEAVAVHLAGRPEAAMGGEGQG